MARSCAKAEFRSVVHGICEVLWIKRLLEDLQVSSPLPMKVYCNNKAAILIAHNPVFHDRTNHIEVDKPIKEKLDSGLICMPYTPTSEQVVDILTSYKGATLEAIRQFDWQVGNGRYLQTSLRSVGRLKYGQNPKGFSSCIVCKYRISQLL